MVIADDAKRFRRCLHRVAPDAAVDVKINKSRCEIVSAKIDKVFAGGSGLLACRAVAWRRRAYCRNSSSFDDDFEAIANPIWKNQTRICEDHVLVGRDSVEPTKCARKFNVQPASQGAEHFQCASGERRPLAECLAS